MKITHHTYEYTLSENNIVIVHYELYKQKESEDRLTPSMEGIEIIKLMLNGEDVTYELEMFSFENIESNIEISLQR
tara:strand:+ start:743 stop:970 length:228 start_codon:yes stop_codon:yes gene_type:complete